MLLQVIRNCLRDCSKIIQETEEWEDVLLTAEISIRQTDRQNNKTKGGALLSGVLKCCSRISARKRISSCFSKTVKAGMTVEACFVLPFFLFAFLNVISIQEIYRLQGNMSAAMHYTAKKMAVYGYEYKEIRGGGTGVAESLGLTYLYAADRVKNMLGTEYLDSSPVSGGAAAVSWLRSDIMNTDDCIDLVAQYCIEPPVAVVGYSRTGMYNRLRTRAWTGYDNAASGNGSGATNEEIVYITPAGDVYHRSRSCAYLKLSIAAVSADILKGERNNSGEKYYPCEECGGRCTDVVYITNYGNRYHSSLGCSKLKRTIQAVPLSKAGGRSACSKCGS